MDSNKLFFELPKNRTSAIKVIGVGGGGNNAVAYMYDQGITGVDFIVCNTDAQALINNPIPNKIQLGTNITEGLGAGANPEIGEQAALESSEDIKNALGEQTKMVFITAGMGGGTGTGAAPIIAEIAKEKGILTVGIVTIPFSFEGRSRLEQAEKGLEKIRKNVDSLIVVKNDKLRELYGNLGYKSGFSKSNEVLSTAAKGIAEVITKNYSINIDLRDARTVLADSGTAIMGSAQACGPNKAQDAIMAALDSPLLNDNKITGAKNVLLLIVSGNDEITVDEIGIINDHIQSESGNSTNIIMGIGEDESLEDNISVTVIATGFPIDDVRNSGKEQEKIIHTLTEDSPIKTSSHLSGKYTNQKNNISENKTVENLTEKKVETFSPVYEEKPKPHIIVLEEEEEITTFNISTRHNKDMVSEEENINLHKIDTSKQNVNSVNLDSKSKKINKTEEKNETNNLKSENIQSTIFTIDGIDDFVSQINSENKSQLQSTDFNPSSQPSNAEIATEEPKAIHGKEDLNELMERKIRERRERLKKLNSKFQNLTKQNIDEVEKIPAYKRQGVNLDEVPDTNGESDILYNKNTNEIKIRPNNFFHDNVD